MDNSRFGIEFTNSDLPNIANARILVSAISSLPCSSLWVSFGTLVPRPTLNPDIYISLGSCPLQNSCHRKPHRPIFQTGHLDVGRKNTSAWTRYKSYRKTILVSTSFTELVLKNYNCIMWHDSISRRNGYFPQLYRQSPAFCRCQSLLPTSKDREFTLFI